MADLVTGPGGAVVDGILHLGGTHPGPASHPPGYRVTAVPTPAGLRYDVTTPSGDHLSWTDPADPGAGTADASAARVGTAGATAAGTTDPGAAGAGAAGADAAGAGAARVGTADASAAGAGPAGDGADGVGARVRVARRTLVLGGARSGKSTTAERMLSDRDDVLYVATGHDGAGDPAWAERIAQHRARRPASWGLAETTDLIPLLDSDGPPLLIDCLTLWLTRVMDDHCVWTEPQRRTEVEHRMTELADAWRRTAREIVAVSNDVGSGVVPATSSGVLFRDLMGRLNTQIAATSDQVLWCLAGRALTL